MSQPNEQEIPPIAQYPWSLEFSFIVSGHFIPKPGLLTLQPAWESCGFGSATCYNYIVIYKFNHFILTTGIALSVSKAEIHTGIERSALHFSIFSCLAIVEQTSIALKGADVNLSGNNCTGLPHKFLIVYNYNCEGNGHFQKSDLHWATVLN